MTNDTPPAADERPRQQPESGWTAFLRTHRRIRSAIVAVLVVLIPILLGVAFYVCWWLLVPRILSWGFSALSWRSVFSAFGLFYVVAAPFLVVAVSFFLPEKILAMYATEADERLRQQIDDAMFGQDELERLLQNEDRHGLVKLVRYSRLQLQAYYRIGLSQTQRSFRYSVIAMWIGFFVIVLGVGSYLIPHYFAQATPAATAQQFTLAGGLIIEIISGAFLWVYKSSISKLTYFFDRQQLSHNTLLSFAIAESMTEKDAAKMKIISQLIASSPEKPEYIQFCGIRKKLLGSKAHRATLSV